MSHFTKLRRTAGGVTLAAVLLFGAASAIPAYADEGCKHAAWTCFVGTTQSGSTVPGTKTELDGGGAVSMLVVRGKLHIVAELPRSSFRAGQEVPVRLTIGHTRFVGTATGLEGGAVVVSGFTQDAVAKLLAADRLLIELPGTRVELGMSGFGEALVDALRRARSGQAV